MHPLIVICGPAGVGKTTIVKALLNLLPELRSSVTYTTRKHRKFSTEDKEMLYISPEEFKTREKRGEFLEWAIVHGDYYGTHRIETEATLNTNPVIFNIDVQGAQQIVNEFRKICLTIFLLPESHEQMVSHIKNRGDITEYSLQARLKSAEIELAKKDLFDYQIVNYEGKLNETVARVAEIIQNYLRTKSEHDAGLTKNE